MSEWVSEWLLLNAYSAMFQLYHGENKLIFIVLAHWNKQQSAVEMSLHSNTLFWLRANQSLVLFLNAACLEEKQQIPIV